MLVYWEFVVRLFFDDDDDDDWVWDDDNILSNYFLLLSLMNLRCVSLIFWYVFKNLGGNGSFDLFCDSMSDWLRSSIFDWLELLIYDKFDFDIIWFKMVYGK